MKTINFGDVLTCTETGKQFTAVQDGCSTNYARDKNDNVFSDDGVDIREKRELLNRSKPYFCYLSGDGKRITGWKGNTLGNAVSYSGRVGFCRNGCYVYATDIHGGKWYGKNAGRGMCITLRAKK
jgi:hypothetical protein